MADLDTLTSALLAAISSLSFPPTSVELDFDAALTNESVRACLIVVTTGNLDTAATQARVREALAISVTQLAGEEADHEGAFSTACRRSRGRSRQARSATLRFRGVAPWI